jgi:hypothetical protein
MNVLFALAALGDLTAVVAHGWVGHRRFLSPLGSDRFVATPTGDAQVSRLIFVVAWHVVTAAFASSACAMLALTFAHGSVAWAPFVAGMHAAFLLVGLFIFRARLSAMWSPIPIVFTMCMLTVVVCTWLGRC